MLLTLIITTREPPSRADRVRPSSAPNLRFGSSGVRLSHWRFAGFVVWGPPPHPALTPKPYSGCLELTTLVAEDAFWGLGSTGCFGLVYVAL